MSVRPLILGCLVFAALFPGCVKWPAVHFNTDIVEGPVDVYPIAGRILERGYRVKKWSIQEYGAVVWLEKVLTIQDDPEVDVYLYFHGPAGQAREFNAAVWARSTSQEAADETASAWGLLKEVSGR